MAIDLEKELARGIPLDEAAEFFIRLRGQTKEASLPFLEAAFNELSPDEQAEVLKTAADEGILAKGTEEYYGAQMLASLQKIANMPGAQAGAPLPPTAQGQNMQQPPPANLPPTAMGANQTKMSSMKEESEKGKERAHASISASHEKLRHSGGERIGKTLGTLVGGGAGGAAAHHLGKGHPGITLAGAGMGALMGRGIGRDLGEGHDARHYAKKMKEAAVKLGFEGSMSPEGAGDAQPDIHQYLAAEEMGQQAEGANAAQYYQQKFQEAAAQLQASQEQAEQTGAMTEQLQQQVAGSQEQIQSAMQQAQLAHQGAMQNVQQAHEMAMGATQQAMEAQGEVLRQKQLAAAMRMGVMQVKDQVMNALAQDPTEQLASQLSSPPPGSAQQQMDPAAAAAQGMQNPSTAAAGNPDPSQQGGPPAQGPAGQAEGAQTQTNSTSPGESGEGASDGNSGKSKGEGSESSTKGSTKVEIKHASPLSLPHALGGAAIGGGIGAAYAHSSNDKLRQKVQELEGIEDRGYGKSMNLAQAKARLELGEIAARHPAITTGLSALGGAFMGNSEGPGLTKSLGEVPGNLREIVQNIQSKAV